MKNLRQIIKIIMTDADLKAVCITLKGNSIALGVDLKKNVEIKKLVDDFSTKLLEALEKEIG